MIRHLNATKTTVRQSSGEKVRVRGLFLPTILRESGY